jgi:uncharacterized protein YecE (DUF72 family)
MRFFVGTSGYDYKEWKRSFYPEKLPQKEMLSYYAQRFPTVEINSTFYRMPKADVLKSWAQQVPDGFRFVLKAPQTITHFKRLKDVEDETRDLLRIASALKGGRGPLFFQLPPNFKKDLPRLEAFLALVGDRSPVAFEFRHASWFDDEVFDSLRRRSCALCISDMDDSPCVDLVRTAGWGYVRLRRERYTKKCLGEWIERMRSQAWDEAYVFFKHENSGTAPRFGAQFLELAGT